MISIVSAALVISYAEAPIAALRQHRPDLPRPFRVKALTFIGPLSFVVATLIVYWTGWQSLRWLLGIQIALYLGYLCVARRTVAGATTTLGQQLRSSLWLVGYYAMILIASYYWGYAWALKHAT